jgi:hypothetical protein
MGPALSVGPKLLAAPTSAIIPASVKHCKSAQVAQVGIEARSITVNCTLKDDWIAPYPDQACCCERLVTAQVENGAPE